MHPVCGGKESGSPVWNPDPQQHLNSQGSADDRLSLGGARIRTATACTACSTVCHCDGQPLPSVTLAESNADDANPVLRDPALKPHQPGGKPHAKDASTSNASLSKTRCNEAAPARGKAAC